MTAVVGILNKHGVAIAADSAVTMSGPNGHKIFNRANKIFTLSKYHPVGIMIYNSASFMGVPWETIIKIYRKELESCSFNTLHEYLENFIKFLKSKNFFSDNEDQERERFLLQESILSFLILEAKDGKKENELKKAKLLEMFKRFQGEWDPGVNPTVDVCPDFVDFKFEEYDGIAKSSGDWQKHKERLPDNLKEDVEIQEEAFKCFYHLIRAIESLSPFTGLVFVGYGETEIFPRLYSINVFLAFSGRLRYYEADSSAEISNQLNGAIRPFAQTDVIDTILTGIDPSLDNMYSQNFENLLNSFKNELVTRTASVDKKISNLIEKIDVEPVVELFNRLNAELKLQKGIYPLMDAVSTLGKEDLAEMAESLIYITYLKRRITFAEESVGGPVDVVIITKGDGFVWIKRKNYFSADLNHAFINGYLNR